MDLERIRALYDFNRWANGRVLEAAEKLSREQFSKDLGSSFSSVQDTLVHIMGAEWIWLERWKGVSPKALLPAAEFPTVSSIRNRWKEIEREQKDFVNDVTEESLKTVISYTNLKGVPYKYPLWQILQHLVNHSTYHRGQVTTMLRQLGAKPLATDFLVYYDILNNSRSKATSPPAAKGKR
ncbi:MAG: DinB family protein [candidate division Zixibacteria bacterium]|nr:DinB family protein [candidate division Zixibacteria bacterium]